MIDSLDFAERIRDGSEPLCTPAERDAVARAVTPPVTGTFLPAPVSAVKSWIVKSAGKVAASEPAHRMAAGFVGIGSALRDFAASAQKQLNLKR